MYHPHECTNLTNDIGLWPLLRTLPQEFLSQLTKFFIFNSGDSAILLNKQCQYFTYGANWFHKLGKKDPKCRYKIEIIDQWFKMNFVQMEEARSHVMALNSRGILYGWGTNKYGQLGLKPSFFEPIKKIKQNVMKVSCGLEHTTVLTFERRVFIWGKIFNDNSNKWIDNNGEIIELRQKQITDIVCSRNGVLFLNDEYELFVYGVIGSMKTIYHKITSIEQNYFEGPIKQIIGWNWSYLLLTMDGSIIEMLGFLHEFPLWTYETNDETNKIQDSGHQDSYFIFQHLQVNHKFSSPNRIVLSKNFKQPNTDNCIFIFEDGYCQIYNYYDNNLIWFTSVADINSLYLNNNTLEWTILPAHITNPSYLVSLNDFNSFRHSHRHYHNDDHPRMNSNVPNDDENDSNDNIKFILNNRSLLAHVSTLMERSPYFFRLFMEHLQLQNDDCQNDLLKKINIDQYSYPVFYSYLRYLYTDTLMIEHNFHNELYQLANDYGEDDLKIKLAMHCKNNKLHNALMKCHTHTRAN